MNKLFKTSVYFMLFAMFVHLIPVQVLADVNDISLNTSDENIILFAEKPNGIIELFDNLDRDNVILSIPDDSLVELVEFGEELSKINYSDVSSNEEDFKIHTGYVESLHIIPLSAIDDFLNKRDDEDFILQDYVIPTDIDDEKFNPDDENILKDEESIDDEKIEIKDELDEELNIEIDDEQNETEDELGDDLNIESEDKSDALINKSNLTQSTKSAINLQGSALQSPTHVYSTRSKSSSVLKSYNQGHNLKFQHHDSNWYKATVYINGKKVTGYIHVNDVILLKNQNNLSGFALENQVNVYTSTKRNSKVLKSYPHGSKLIYRSFIPGWYQATVYINGKPTTGYINASDVGPEVRHKGIALSNRVSVYSSTSKNSKVLKSYNQGHTLIYTKFNNSWYKATVYINGKAQTGYIHTSDIDQILIQDQITLKGIGMNSSTKVYSTPSTKSKSLKTYNQGHILQYRTFSNNWYQATVIINGKRQTGYIAKHTVENAVGKPQRLNGIAVQGSTKVYSKATTNASVLKSYSFASPLVYRTFTSNWYEATVYINGKAKTGYIHKNNVLQPLNKRIVIDAGHGGYDSGSSGLGIIEKDLNLDIALRTQAILKKAGATVIMTRTNDIFIPLSGRAAIANNSNADIFISIHGNSFNGMTNGIETFWYGKYERQNSIKLAHSLQNNLVSSMGMKYRRVADGNFHVIRETKIPSSLVEVGFIDNLFDATKLRQDKYRQLAAEGILLGTLDYFN